MKGGDSNELLVLFLEDHCGVIITMALVEHQYIEFVNVLSYRTRVDIKRLEKLISYVERNTDALGLKITGNLVFTVTEVFELSDRLILGIELLVPVNKAFESCEQYVYKPRFRLVNAVSVRFGNLRDFFEASDELMRYLKQNHLNAASEIYYIIDCDCEHNELPMIYDALVSVNDNMV